MLLGRHPQFFKLAFIAVVAIIFITAATRQRLSSLGSDIDPREEFLNQAEAKIINENNGNANKNSENQNNNDEQQEENIGGFDDGDNQIPFDESMPGAYLRFKEPAETNKSFCKYNYGFPYDLEYMGLINTSTPEEGYMSPYRIIYNIVEAHDVENVAQVTYASHVTVNFAYFIPELLRFWEGIITIAAFVPDLDVALFLEQINQYCYCEPEMHRVSIHVVTHKAVPFSKKDIYFDRPSNCIPEDSSRIATYKDYEDTMVYPINVLRNVARTSALTKYVLLSDIELMPSKGLASGFLKMIEKYKKHYLRKVFVLPIFEVEETESIPENKDELIGLIQDKRAVYFHELICIHCQRFPGIDKWMASAHSEAIKPLLTVKRHKPFNRWEPIFIGTNNEPLYSEKLSWEGLQDKMTQSLEMCLMDYNYTILDNAFLCHWPGIKTQKVAAEEWRINYILENKVAYKGIIKGLQEKYVDIPGCLVNDSSAILTVKKKDSRALI